MINRPAHGLRFSCRFGIVSVYPFLLLIALCPRAHGQTTGFWLDPVSGNWTDAARWSTNPLYPGQPGVDEAVVSVAGAPYTIDSATPIFLTRFEVASPDATFQLSAGTFHVNDLNLTTGNATVNGGTLSLLDGRFAGNGLLRVNGGRIEAMSLVEVRNGMRVEQTGGFVAPKLFQMYRADYHLSGGTLRLGGSSISSGGQASIAPVGTASLIQTGGTIEQGGDFVIVGALSSSGTGGDGQLVVDSASSVYRTTDFDGTTAIGAGTAATGRATFRNGSLAELVEIDVGSNAAHGSLTVESGARLTARRMQIGTASFFYSGNSGSFINGHGTVTLGGAGTQVTITGATPGLCVVGGTSTLTSSGRLVVNDGSAFSTGVLRVTSAGTVQFNGGSFDSGITQIPGGQFDVAAAGNERLLRVASLSVTGAGGQLDLGDNAMLVGQNAVNTPIENIRALIASGHASGAWTGDGVASSAAAASPGHALGYAQASELTAIPPIFGDVQGAAVLVRFTRYGDADLDHVVDLDDFTRLAGHFGQSNAFWHQGDFNYDGAVNLADFNLLAGNFGLSATGPTVTPADWSALASAIPEPGATASLLVIILLARRGHVFRVA